MLLVYANQAPRLHQAAPTVTQKLVKQMELGVPANALITQKPPLAAILVLRNSVQTTNGVIVCLIVASPMPVQLKSVDKHLHVQTLAANTRSQPLEPLAMVATATLQVLASLCAQASAQATAMITQAVQ
jgi:hypothetical protein